MRLALLVALVVAGPAASAQIGTRSTALYADLLGPTSAYSVGIEQAVWTSPDASRQLRLRAGFAYWSEKAFGLLYQDDDIIAVPRPSNNLITAGRQQLTRRWWEHERDDYDLLVSEFVLSEAAGGDPGTARLRLDALVGIPEVRLPHDAEALARALIKPGPIPIKAALDASHIAAAVAGGADYLLTWNFKHLANAALRKRIDQICRSSGYDPPVICTPEELSQL